MGGADVVDYGSYPDQQRTYFTLRDARHTLATVSEGTGLEGSIYAGLESLTDQLLGREWQRDDGAANVVHIVPPSSSLSSANLTKLVHTTCVSIPWLRKNGRSYFTLCKY